MRFFRVSLGQRFIFVGVCAALCAWWVNAPVSSVPHRSNRDLDLAIFGQGYFPIIDPTSGQTMYTRRGGFSLDSDGLMVWGSPLEGRLPLRSFACFTIMSFGCDSSWWMPSYSRSIWTNSALSVPVGWVTRAEWHLSPWTHSARVTHKLSVDRVLDPCQKSDVMGVPSSMRLMRRPSSSTYVRSSMPIAW